MNGSPLRLRYRLLLRFLRLVGWLVPVDRRAEWYREWAAELAHAARSAAGVDSRRGVRLSYRALLALQDAWTVRRAADSWRAVEEAHAGPARRVRGKALDGVLQDLRISLRALGRRPTFTAAVVLTLALGVGASTAMFSVVNAVLGRPLPYAQAERLVAIWPRTFMANREVAQLREAAARLDAVAAESPGWLMALTGVAVPELVNAARVTGNLFPLLDVAPELGRPFGPAAERPGGEPVAVLGHALWQRAFGSEPGIIGRTITLAGSAYTVVAVMPDGFSILDSGADLWVPLAMDAAEFTWQSPTALVLGRLAPGATRAAAAAELQTLVGRMRAAFDKPADWGKGASVQGLKDAVVGGLGRTLWILLGAVGFLLLISCVNVANLLLVRASDRGDELAVRLALGAGPGRILRLFLAESTWIAAMGGTSGVLLALAGVQLLRRLLPASTPRIAEIGIDGTVLAVAAGTTLCSALVFGAAPGLAALRRSMAQRLRHARTVAAGGRARGVLVAAEMALAFALVSGAALMARTLLALQSVDPGLQPSHLLTLRLQPTGRAAQNPDAYWAQVFERVRGTPGVQAAGAVMNLPLTGRKWVTPYEVEGRPLLPGETPPAAAWQTVSPGYFEAAGIALRAGRTFTDADGPESPRVVMVNDVFAVTAFAGMDPVGRQIRAGNPTANGWATIVGVVGAVHHDSLNTAPQAEIYAADAQVRFSANALVVRTTGNPAALAAVLRRHIQDIDPDVPISNVRTMDDLIAASIQRPRVVLALLAVFAAVGLALGIVGMGGVVACAVKERSREIAVRMALGADGPGVTRMIVLQGLGWATAGILIGLPATLALTRLLRGLVFGISPADPLTFTAVPVALFAVAALASWLPARRTSRLPPATVLRE